MKRLEHPCEALLSALTGVDAHFPQISFERLNDCIGRSSELRFEPQTPALLADGLHYEERIAHLGIIATRAANTHDLFNALVWIEHTAIKRAMNVRQVADIARVGPKRRTRGQCALTHFDEAGAIVWIADSSLLEAWDAHDWPRFFLRDRDAWGSRIAITVIGHALFDYAWTHREPPVAKALAVHVDASALADRADGAVVRSWPLPEQAVARRIAKAEILDDPQELRPLPLAGVPGWHADADSPRFFSDTPCFRPLREGRRYPAPLLLSQADDKPTLKHSFEVATIR
jgi:hypothetical protein